MVTTHSRFLRLNLEMANKGRVVRLRVVVGGRVNYFNARTHDNYDTREGVNHYPGVLHAHRPSKTLFIFKSRLRISSYLSMPHAVAFLCDQQRPPSFENTRKCQLVLSADTKKPIPSRLDGNLYLTDRLLDRNEALHKGLTH